jgi:hypothetical protein
MRRGFPRRSMNNFLIVARALMCPVLLSCAPPAARAEIGLEKAVIVTARSLTKVESSAVTMLVEEVSKRTRIRLPVLDEWPKDPIPVIALGTATASRAWAGPYAGQITSEPARLPAEGYSLRTPAGCCASCRCRPTASAWLLS